MSDPSRPTLTRHKVARQLGRLLRMANRATGKVNEWLLILIRILSLVDF